MKKVIFATLVLAIGLWSCSQNEGNDDTGYVDVTIGSKSGSLKSYVAPGGVTSWNLNDNVMVISSDGDIQKFSYIEETVKSNAKFKGMLKSGQGRKVYKAYHAPDNSHTSLEDGHILVMEREDIILEAKDQNYNSTIFGSYCPMVAIPIEFDANNADHQKNFQFYHMTTMILGKLGLRETDTEIREKVFDCVKFEVMALNGKKPFYSTIKLDLDMLSTSSELADFDEYIINKDDKNIKTDRMSTSMNFKDRGDNFRIEDLLDEYSQLETFPIPIIALPTDDCFRYEASISFYKNEELVVKFAGVGDATGLAPAGLNNLDFNHEKIVSE